MTEDADLNEKIFLQADQLTEIKPLRLQFFRGQIQLTKNNRDMIRQWVRQVTRYDIPVYIHSFASSPTGIRNMSKQAAHHEAVRIAFNRGLVAKNFLEQNGIRQNRLILKAVGPNPANTDDAITLTTRRD
ncbi:MAG: hypothetical protein JKY59_02750 [Emcibacter sp.]|nr:hypothetical protein [Emcibacter sp.]